MNEMYRFGFYTHSRNIFQMTCFPWVNFLPISKTILRAEFHKDKSKNYERKYNYFWGQNAIEALDTCEWPETRSSNILEKAYFKNLLQMVIVSEWTSRSKFRAGCECLAVKLVENQLTINRNNSP